eukprot:3646568-Amphidinium_carterae.1
MEDNKCTSPTLEVCAKPDRWHFSRRMKHLHAKPITRHMHPARRLLLAAKSSGRIFGRRLRYAMKK